MTYPHLNLDKLSRIRELIDLHFSASYHFPIKVSQGYFMHAKPVEGTLSKLTSELLGTNPVLLRLRNPFRVLNHLELIQLKLRIGQELGLVSPSGDTAVPNMDLLSATADRTVSTSSILSELVERLGAHLDEERIKTSLLRCYSTGLLELHITDVCDLDCVDCHYRSKGSSTIPFERLRDVVDRLKPRAITITGGGEPNAYKSTGKYFGDVVEAIHSVLPGTQLGLINNNSRIPLGSWPRLIGWQRSSIDAASAKTYMTLKRRPVYDTVVANTQRLLCETGIQDVGVGFLYRPENVHELYAFIDLWFEWIKEQSAAIQTRFNMQFRPIAPGIEKVADLRDGQIFPDSYTLETLREQLALTRARMARDEVFDKFVRNNTNFVASFGESSSPCDSRLFIHRPRFFEHCFNALCHRVFRATGEEFPDFLLCNERELAMGNTFENNPEEEMIRVALMQFYYYNKRGPYCRPEICRQGWVSQVVEESRLCSENAEPQQHGPHNYFF